MRINERTGPELSDAKKKTKTEKTHHEIVVQVATRKGAPKIPKGELHVVAYVENEVLNAKQKGGKYQPALGARSSSLKEVTPKPVKIENLEAGKSSVHEFKVTTQNMDTRHTFTVIKKGKKNKTSKSERTTTWKHHQSLVGVRVRLLIKGQLADETYYPTDLETQIAKVRKSR